MVYYLFMYTYELQNHTYFASFAPFGVCKLLTRRAVAVPLGYVSLYFKIIICEMSIEILGSINCNEIYMNEGATVKLCYSFVSTYLSQGHYREETNKTNNKEETKHPTKGETFCIDWCVPPINLSSNVWTHPK